MRPLSKKFLLSISVTNLLIFFSYLFFFHSLHFSFSFLLSFIFFPSTLPLAFFFTWYYGHTFISKLKLAFFLNEPQEELPYDDENSKQLARSRSRLRLRLRSRIRGVAKLYFVLGSIVYFIVFFYLSFQVCFLLMLLLTPGPVEDQGYSEVTPSLPILNNKRFLIAANFYNNEDTIPIFADEIVKLSKYIGPERLFVSVYENGSKDSSKWQLKRLEGKLIANNIDGLIIPDSTIKPKMDIEIDRIEYFAKLRNKVLDPLFQREELSSTITHVLFVNDVAFSVEDFLHLLFTNDMDYDAACSLDFQEVGTLYDRWVIRDTQGELLAPSYPFFKGVEDQGNIYKREPFPVFTCWNGMMFMKSEPFLKKSLRFRNSFKNDGCYQSECFLICQDLRVLGATNILVNPNVLVTYSPSKYSLNRFYLLSPLAQKLKKLLGITKESDLDLKYDPLANGKIANLKKYVPPKMNMEVDCVDWV